LHLSPEYLQFLFETNNGLHNVIEFLKDRIWHRDEELLETVYNTICALLKLYTSPDSSRKKVVETLFDSLAEPPSVRSILNSLDESYKDILIKILTPTNLPWLEVSPPELKFSLVKKILNTNSTFLPACIKEIPDEWIKKLSPRQCLALFKKIMLGGDFVKVNHDLLHKKASFAIVESVREDARLVKAGKTFEKIVANLPSRVKKVCDHPKAKG